jgi:hypothetical protein
MIQNLIDLKMSDRFTPKIKVHPRSWTRKRPPNKFKLVLFHHDIPIRESHHPSLEDAEQSIREFLELGLGGRGEIYEH